ncbi:MAG: formate dehydrogenase accessory sulfurtransferase FdhD [Candidatus Thermoplasmatota archaeon]|nr:formate dehydrogenase accessory sulfurtransferase FdhD [Candidatus Thermoplasmatota archaeon]MDA8143544.1 formate dehydrogenase accessory sulfurtransferase FdhD [Thermoplasmatales archaeon]
MQRNSPESYNFFKTLKYSASSGIEDTRDRVTVEEPLEIRLSSKKIGLKTVSIIMRTPVMDDYLAVGFLFSEGIIKNRRDIISVDNFDEDTGKARDNIIVIRVAENVAFDGSEYSRNFIVNSSCGVCGKSNINAVFLKTGKIVRSTLKINKDIILTLPEKMKGLQTVFGETGGIHAAGLFTFDGNPIIVAEDVGRHNAVDKVVGYMLINEMISRGDVVLQVSGRAGFEILQKSAIAGIPVVSSVSAPSSLAVQTAESMNMTLVCFVRENRFNIYTNPERIEI